MAFSEYTGNIVGGSNKLYSNGTGKINDRKQISICV